MPAKKPTTVSTVAQLDALPVFTVLLMEPQQVGYGEGTAPWVVQKLWHSYGSTAFSSALPAAALLARFGPLTVVWRPAATAAPDTTKETRSGQ